MLLGFAERNMDGLGTQGNGSIDWVGGRLGKKTKKKKKKTLPCASIFFPVGLGGEFGRDFYKEMILLFPPAFLDVDDESFLFFFW